MKQIASADKRGAPRWRIKVMNHAKYIPSAAWALLSAACSFPPAAPRAELIIAPASEAWSASLGEPVWSVHWFDPEGAAQRRDGVRGRLMIEAEQEGARPVLAWPYWPDYGIGIGHARPYGAVCPYGLDNGRLRLDAPGGVCASFFVELAAAGGQGGTAPEYFDWPRFAELIRSDAVPDDFRADPWSADWTGIASKTRASGFDSRRLVPRSEDLPPAPAEFTVPGPGPWATSSPFRSAPSWKEGETIVLEWTGADDAYLSAGGILRSGRGFVAWFPLPPAGPSGRLRSVTFPR